ncbi:hypothetical protein PVAP13_4KG218200 [Panicum virgatum]|uniref:Uncharacterized protein n=1 Tax=Panicum virgatum TaxID=38727 RepID=A0A8T0TP04_PANVG|nr:hypothetical protein PVAP13_4KG218200 [Panicum virgatum]
MKTLRMELLKIEIAPNSDRSRPDSGGAPAASIDSRNEEHEQRRFPSRRTRARYRIEPGDPNPSRRAASQKTSTLIGPPLLFDRDTAPRPARAPRESALAPPRSRSFSRAAASSMTLGAGSDDAPLDLGSNGATGEKASSDDPVDLEKGATGSKAAAAEEEELDRRAMWA